MNTNIFLKFKMPTMKAYDVTSDPANHVKIFSNASLIQPVNDVVKCRVISYPSGHGVEVV